MKSILYADAIVKLDLFDDTFSAHSHISAECNSTFLVGKGLSHRLRPFLLKALMDFYSTLPYDLVG